MRCLGVDDSHSYLRLRKPKNYLSSNDMGNIHEIVINHISEMISRIPIGLEKDLVIDCIIVEHHFAVNDVLEFG